MSKISKLNNNLHIGMGSTETPKFIGEVTSLTTDLPYVTIESDHMIRPDGGSVTTGYSRDAVSFGGYVYAVKGNLLTRIRKSTGVAEAAAIDGTSDLMTICVFNKNYVDFIILVDDLGETCNIYTEALHSIIWGETNLFTSVFLNFNGVRMGHFVTPSDNPLGVNGRIRPGANGTTEPSSYEGMATQSFADDGQFVITDMKYNPNDELIYFQIMSGSSNTYALNECIIYTVPWESTDWNVENILPKFIPLESFGSARSLVDPAHTNSGIADLRSQEFIDMIGLYNQNVLNENDISELDFPRTSSSTRTHGGYSSRLDAGGIPMPFYTYHTQVQKRTGFSVFPFVEEHAGEIDNFVNGLGMTTYIDNLDGQRVQAFSNCNINTRNWNGWNWDNLVWTPDSYRWDLLDIGDSFIIEENNTQVSRNYDGWLPDPSGNFEYTSGGFVYDNVAFAHAFISETSMVPGTSVFNSFYDDAFTNGLIPISSLFGAQGVIDGEEYDLAQSVTYNDFKDQITNRLWFGGEPKVSYPNKAICISHGGTIIGDPDITADRYDVGNEVPYIFCKPFTQDDPSAGNSYWMKYHSIQVEFGSAKWNVPAIGTGNVGQNEDLINAYAHTSFDSFKESNLCAFSVADNRVLDLVGEDYIFSYTEDKPQIEYTASDMAEVTLNDYSVTNDPYIHFYKIEGAVDIAFKSTVRRGNDFITNYDITLHDEAGDGFYWDISSYAYGKLHADKYSAYEPAFPETPQIFYNTPARIGSRHNFYNYTTGQWANDHAGLAHTIGFNFTGDILQTYTKDASASGWTESDPDTYLIQNVPDGSTVATDYVSIVVTLNTGSASNATFTLDSSEIASISAAGLITFAAGTGVFITECVMVISYKTDNDAFHGDMFAPSVDRLLDDNYTTTDLNSSNFMRFMNTSTIFDVHDTDGSLTSNYPDMQAIDFTSSYNSVELACPPTNQNVLTTDDTQVNTAFVKLTVAEHLGTEDNFLAPFEIEYRYSLIYDVNQETPLSLIPDTFQSSAINYHAMKIEVEFNPVTMSDRVTHICIYRKYIKDDGVSGDTHFGLIHQREIRPLANFALNENGIPRFVYVDEREPVATYESITGVSEKYTNLSINYNLSATIDSYMFVANGSISYSVEDWSYYIFRSMPNRFSQFNWAVDYAILPDKPVAMVGFNGRLFVFTLTSILRINPATLEIEDEYKGVSAAGPTSVATTEFGMLFVDNNNIYFHDGTKPIIISDKISTTFSQFIVKNSNASSYTSPVFNADALFSIQHAIGWKNISKSNIHVIYDPRRS
jgi:hypothetical protein